jgi:hypothetical protein
MDGIWFTNVSPVKARCLHSWICNGTGSILAGSDPQNPTVSDRASPQARQPDRMLPTIRDLSIQTSVIDASNKSASVSSDSEIIQKLEFLVADTKEAFQAVLFRNSKLQEALDMRTREKVATCNPERSTLGSTSYESSTCLSSKPPVNDWSHYDQNVFDISTPQTRSNSRKSSSRVSEPISLSELNKRPQRVGGPKTRLDCMMLLPRPSDVSF